MESSSSNSEERELQQCKELKTHLEFLHHTNRRFEIAFRIFFQEETPFKKFFDSKEVNALDFHNKSWQNHFKDYTRQEPETYRCNLLRFLDELDKIIDERVIKYGELQMKEREGTTLEDNLSTNDIALDATSVIEGSAIEACLVTKGATLDSLVAKESTVDSSTSSE
ncbi:hypothetical protein Tco_1319089 [Tanacetum coccineum]